MNANIYTGWLGLVNLLSNTVSSCNLISSNENLDIVMILDRFKDLFGKLDIDKNVMIHIMAPSIISLER